MATENDRLQVVFAAVVHDARGRATGQKLGRTGLRNLYDGGGKRASTGEVLDDKG
uniref:Uncharacterized protein n=1 Tax=Peronospora matthiolae TaxID=2874970 RepID=A0AAV1USB1_9STRA